MARLLPDSRRTNCQKTTTSTRQAHRLPTMAATWAHPSCDGDMAGACDQPQPCRGVSRIAVMSFVGEGGGERGLGIARLSWG